jgi:hypothetical protein
MKRREHAVTVDHRLIFDFEDIRAIRIECENCKVQVLYGLFDPINIPSVCPNCSKEFGAECQRTFDGIVKAVKILFRLQTELQKSCHLRLEFDDPTK